MINKLMKSAIPQITLLLTQFLFLTVLVGGFSFISRASFTAYENLISPMNVEEKFSALYD